MTAPDWDEERWGPWIVGVFIALLLIAAAIGMLASPSRRPPDDPGRIESSCWTSSEAAQACP